MRGFRLTTHLAALIALISLAGIAGCGEESTVGPVTVPDDGPDLLVGEAILLPSISPMGRWESDPDPLPA